MTPQPAVALLDAAAERRWHEWQARGAEADRRIAARMRVLMLVLAVAIVCWFVVELV